MSFTSQQRQVATEKDCSVTKWSGAGPGVRFRCYLCGHKFIVGEGWRWVYSAGRTFENADEKRMNGVINFICCDSCDGPDVLDRWVERNREFYGDKFWALRCPLRSRSRYRSRSR